MGTEKKRYLVDYEARHPGAQGTFTPTRVEVHCDSAREAVAQAREHLHWQDLETRNPVRVHRGWGSDLKVVPYVPWREGSDDNPAGLREDLLDAELEARATTSRLELALLADPQVRVKKGGES